MYVAAPVAVLAAAALAALAVLHQASAIVVPTPNYDCSEVQCTQDCTSPTLDFVFMIDTSVSVSPYIFKVAEDVGQFARDLEARSIRARMAVIGFQGFAELIVDWTSNATVISERLIELATCIFNDRGIRGGCRAGGVTGSCTPPNCVAASHQAITGQEALFDTIRQSTGRECVSCNLYRINTSPLGTSAPKTPLTFRPGARRFVLGMADEDSDRPFNYAPEGFGLPHPNEYCRDTAAGNRCQYQSKYVINSFQPDEPPNNGGVRYGEVNASGGWVYPEWIAETEATARALIDLDAELAIFTRDSRACYQQFGDPNIQAQNQTDYSNFDIIDTINNYHNAPLKGVNNLTASIQYIMLSQFATARVFPLGTASANADVYAKYFNQVVQALDISDCDQRCASYQCLDDVGCVVTPTCATGCDQCFIGGSCYINGDTDPAAPASSCRRCDVSRSNNSWTTDCDDGNACSVDVCVGNGICDNSERVCPSVACGTCQISGACYNVGDPNPTNTSERCEPAASLTSWTAITGPFCNPIGNCNGATCGVINDGCGSFQFCGLPCPTLAPECINGQCQCVPATCASLGVECGIHEDKCGKLLDCGSCGAGTACAANHVCAPTTCAPTVTCNFPQQRECGFINMSAPDCPANVSCGSCPSNKACDQATGRCTVCVPAETCASGNRECSFVDAGCGTEICGNFSCPALEQCSPFGRCEPIPTTGSTGTTNVPSSTGTTDALTTGAAAPPTTSVASSTTGAGATTGPAAPAPSAPSASTGGASAAGTTGASSSAGITANSSTPPAPSEGAGVVAGAARLKNAALLLACLLALSLLPF